MKKFTAYLCAILLYVPAFAQENGDLLSRIFQANMHSSLQANWNQTRHSEFFADNLLSSGVVYMKQPDKLRWEVSSPVQSVSIMAGGASRSRFRFPEAKDFDTKILDSDKEYSIILQPKRGDLQQFFSQVILKVEKNRLLIKSALINGDGGDWTLLEFSSIQTDKPLPDSLFEK